MTLERREYPYLAVFLIPAFVVFLTFFLLPMAKLVMVAGSGPSGFMEYLTVIRTPRHFESLVATVLLSAATTLAALAISTISGVFLERNKFWGVRLSSQCSRFPWRFQAL